MGVVSTIALGLGSYNKDLHGPGAVVLTAHPTPALSQGGVPKAGREAAFGPQQGLPTQLKP